MALRTTTLSAMLNRMDRYQEVSVVEQTYKVRDIDEAIRTLRREMSPPWVQKQTTIAIFKDVLIYPVASDHQHLALVEQSLNKEIPGSFRPRLNSRYTSLKQFYQDRDPRNLICEIWDGGERFLGIRYKNINATSARISSTTASNYTASGDASGITAETVQTIDGVDSIKFTVTLSASSATVTEALTSFSDADYLKKYFFRQVYFDSVPTNVQLRFGNDSSNYLSKTVTTQFSGQAFKADAWNLLAFDLNTATTTGTITSTAFDYTAIILTGAATGTYFIGPAYLRGYRNLDYYYYSIYNIKTESGSVLDKEYFFTDSTNTYATGDSLVGDSEWIDCVVFDASLSSLSDGKNKDVIQTIAEKRATAWRLLQERYPDNAEIIITEKYSFGEDPNLDNLYETR